MNKKVRNDFARDYGHERGASEIVRREKFDVSQYREPGCSDDDIWEMKEIFDLLDVNRTGEIDLKHLFQLMKSMNLKSMKFKHTETFKLIKKLELKYGVGGLRKSASALLDDSEEEPKQTIDVENSDESVSCSSGSDILEKNSESSESSSFSSSEEESENAEIASARKSAANRESVELSRESVSELPGLPPELAKPKRKGVTFDMFIKCVQPMFTENNSKESLLKCWKHMLYGSENKKYLTLEGLDVVSQELNLNFTANELLDMVEFAVQGDDEDTVTFDEFYTVIIRVAGM